MVKKDEVAKLRRANGDSVECVERLKNYVERRQSIFISGGTGTGKTALLNAVGKLISYDDRILLIEDTSEIQLQKPNLVHLTLVRHTRSLPPSRSATY